MNATRDPETILAAWLDEGPVDLPDVTRRAIVTALPTTSQARRGPFAPWRLPMPTFTRAAVAATLAVIAFGGAVSLLAPRQGVGPAPTPSSTSGVTGPDVPALDATFTSRLHGYSLRYPSSWSAESATALWRAGEGLPWGNPTLDDLHSSEVRLVAASQPVGEKSGPEWIADLASSTGQSCRGSSVLPATIPVGSEVGTVTLNGCRAAGGGIAPSGIVYDVLVVSGNRGYDFTVDGIVDAAYVQAILATVTFRPGEAVANIPEITPSPLEGEVVYFLHPFSYTLPAGEGIIVTATDTSLYQFRVPIAGTNTYGNGVVFRAVVGGRADPCDEGSSTLELGAGPQAVFDYLATVPTTTLSDVVDVTIDGRSARSGVLHIGEATAACPDLWLWDGEGSITQNSSRNRDVPIGVVDVAGGHVVIMTVAEPDWFGKAEKLIDSIDFRGP